MKPIQVNQIGSGTTTPIIPDIYQNPFSIGLGVNIATGAATYIVEHCFEFSTVMSPTWNGTSNVTWFPNSGFTSSLATSVATWNGNYAFPVAAIRLNVSSTNNATATVTLNFLQSVNSP